MTEREKLFITEFQVLFNSVSRFNHRASIREVKSSYEFDEFLSVWKKYFFESFEKIFPDSKIFLKYSDLFVKYGILYNSDSKEGLTYNYCDTNKLDFENHGLVYLRNANDCRLSNYIIFEAENCKNLTTFGKTIGKIFGNESTITATNRSRIEATNIAKATISDEVYMIANNVKHIVCKDRSIVNIGSVPEEGMIIEKAKTSTVVGNDLSKVSIKPIGWYIGG